MASEATLLIRKVSRAGDHYHRILGIEKGASDFEIKKAYRQLALLLHPDKCNEVGAEEAFKRVGEAFTVLSDADKRQKFGPGEGELLKKDPFYRDLSSWLKHLNLSQHQEAFYGQCKKMGTLSLEEVLESVDLLLEHVPLGPSQVKHLQLHAQEAFTAVRIEDGHQDGYTKTATWVPTVKVAQGSRKRRQKELLKKAEQAKSKEDAERRRSAEKLLEQQLREAAALERSDSEAFSAAVAGAKEVGLPAEEIHDAERQLNLALQRRLQVRNDALCALQATLEASKDESFGPAVRKALQEVPFKQRFLSNSHDDLVPCKYVLPHAEAEHVALVKPGTNWRIMDNLVVEKGQEVQKRMQNPERDQKHLPQVVEKLSHLARNIPVTILAVYPDQTCDVELASKFIAQWENQPHKPYAFQGSVIVGKHMDISEMAIRSAPVGAGDVGERKQPASFNVYDAALTTTHETVRIDPRRIGSGYNPRLDPLIDGTVDDMSVLGGHRGSYRIAAGPLPADANPTDCQYEWSLHLNAANEPDMYHFVTMLRQAARMNIYEQAFIDEVSAKAGASSLLPRTISPEVQGRGSTVNLFTSKAALLDSAGMRHVSVPSMVELKVRELLCPSDDPSEEARLYKYFVEATCCGVKRSTAALCRPKKAWGYLVPSDPSQIDFKASSIFLPVPPGSWSDKAPVVVKIYKCMVYEPTLNFQELLAHNGKTSPPPPAPESVYHAELSLESMTLDFSRKSASVPFAKAKAAATSDNAAKDELSPVESPAIALRDRDFARLQTAQDVCAGAVCVGDKAMVQVEEPISYPSNEEESFLFWLSSFFCCGARK